MSSKWAVFLGCCVLIVDKLVRYLLTRCSSMRNNEALLLMNGIMCTPTESSIIDGNSYILFIDHRSSA